MSEPGTAEWFIEHGVPPEHAGTLAAVEAGVPDPCVRQDADVDDATVVIGPDELAALDDGAP